LIDNDGKRWTTLRMAGFIRDKESVKVITGTEKDPKIIEVKALDGSQKVVWVDDEGLKKIKEFIDGKLVLEKKGICGARLGRQSTREPDPVSSYVRRSGHTTKRQ
jgi:hypothetical protein